MMDLQSRICLNPGTQECNSAVALFVIMMCFAVPCFVVPALAFGAWAVEKVKKWQSQ